MTVIGDDDFAHASKAVVFKLDVDLRGVGVECVPNDLGERRDGLGAALALDKVLLDFDSIFVCAHLLPLNHSVISASGSPAARALM